MQDPIQYIHKNIELRGIIPQAHRFKSIVTHSPQKVYTLEAYNELIYINNLAVLPIGTRIYSDTNCLEIEQSYQGLEVLEEFSGLIKLELPEGVNSYPVVELIQIVL